MPDIINWAIEKNELSHILLDEPKVPAPGQVRDVVHGARNEIVDGDDLVPSLEQQVHQMRAKKPRAAGHNGHRMPVAGFAFVRFTHIRRQGPAPFITTVLGPLPGATPYLA